MRPSSRHISPRATLGAGSVPEPETSAPQNPAPQNDKLLIAEGLEVSYGATQVLWGVSFNVARGKVTCIIGANGAGKTTSPNTIAGILRRSEERRVGKECRSR